MSGEAERISACDDDTAPKCAQEPSPRPTAPAVRWPGASRHRRFILPPPRPPVPPPLPPCHTKDRLPARGHTFLLAEPEQVGVSSGRGAAAGDGGGRHQTIAALAPPVLRTCGDGRHARECRDPLAAASRRTFPQEARGTTHGIRSTKIDVPLRNQTWASFVHVNSIQ